MNKKDYCKDEVSFAKKGMHLYMSQIRLLVPYRRQEKMIILSITH
jgi:hypothetical protein